MSSLFSDSTIAKIKKYKKTFLWAAVCILIGELVVGVILILAHSFSETIGKLMATFGLCAVALFVGVNNFSRMEKGERLVQGFALTSLIANAIWLVLAILLIWELIPFMDVVKNSYSSSSYSGLYPAYHLSYVMTWAAKTMFVTVEIAFACFLISNVLAIAETEKPVKPLKITALICELYCGIYAIVLILGDISINVFGSSWYQLAVLMGFAFVVMALAAAIISRNGAKKNEREKNVQNKNLNDADVQAKIQEMVEKEVQARMAAQQNQPPVLNPDSDLNQPEPQPEIKHEIISEPQPEPETPTEASPESEMPDGHFE